MQLMLQQPGSIKDYKHHISEQIEVVTIQRTARTHDIGKWLVIMREKDFDTAAKHIGNALPEEYMTSIPTEYHLTGFRKAMRVSNSL